MLPEQERARDRAAELAWHASPDSAGSAADAFRSFAQGEQRGLPPSQSIALLLAATGMGIGELLALRWRDVDLKAGKVQIRQTVYEGVFDDPKTKRSRCTVPLGKQGIAILARYRASGADSGALVSERVKERPYATEAS